MLSEVIFAVEGSGLGAFLIATSVVVCRQMLTAGIYGVAIHTLRLAGSLVSNYLAQRCAKPLLERQMKTLFVPRPVASQ
jgi:hypothetical protein